MKNLEISGYKGYSKDCKSMASFSESSTMREILKDLQAFGLIRKGPGKYPKYYWHGFYSQFNNDAERKIHCEHSVLLIHEYAMINDFSSPYGMYERIHPLNTL